MLGLTFKNYYKVVITWISWLHNLFYNLTTNKAWINIITTKRIKFRKLISGTIDLETRMRKYHSEARDGGYAMVSVHAAIKIRCWRWWLEESCSPKQASEACCQSPFPAKKWLFRWHSDEERRSKAGKGDSSSGHGQKWPCMKQPRSVLAFCWP